MLHDTSASARALTTRVPTGNDIGPLRLPDPGADEPEVMCAFRGARRGGERRELPAGGSFEC